MRERTSQGKRRKQVASILVLTMRQHAKKENGHWAGIGWIFNAEPVVESPQFEGVKKPFSTSPSLIKYFWLKENWQLTPQLVSSIR